MRYGGFKLNAAVVLFSNAPYFLRLHYSINSPHASTPCFMVRHKSTVLSVTVTEIIILYTAGQGQPHTLLCSGDVYNVLDALGSFFQLL